MSRVSASHAPARRGKAPQGRAAAPQLLISLEPLEIFQESGRGYTLRLLRIFVQALPGRSSRGREVLSCLIARGRRARHGSPAAPVSEAAPRYSERRPAGQHLVEQDAEPRRYPRLARSFPSFQLTCSGAMLAGSADPSAAQGQLLALPQSAAPARNRRPWACPRP